LLGDTDSVGIILGVRDGPIDSEGFPLDSVVGLRLVLGSMLGLSLGPMIDAEEGSMDIDGIDEGLIDGPIL
jgi:hypothetical protein